MWIGGTSRGISTCIGALRREQPVNFYTQSTEYHACAACTLKVKSW